LIFGKRLPSAASGTKTIRSPAARMMATYSDANSVRVQRLFAKSGYTTPVAQNGCAVAVAEDGAHPTARDPLESWTMPGGWADVNQSRASECVIRELREKTGPEVTVRKPGRRLRSLAPGHQPHPFHVYRLCDVVGGTPEVGLETGDLAFLLRKLVFYENLGL
jgi:ADP-ribose pyrophosphatase YjhB (NUDIX family)